MCILVWITFAFTFQEVGNQILTSETIFMEFLINDTFDIPVMPVLNIAFDMP